MTSEHFESLVAEAGLSLLSKHAPRFLVSLRVINKLYTTDGDVVYSTRHICDVLSFEPAEFAMMTPERAQSQIAMCKARLEKAAKTNHGDVTRYETAKTKAKPATRGQRRGVATQKIIKYPAH